MSNFLTKGFPTDRWALTDSASLITNCISSIDSAIRTVFQITEGDGSPKTDNFDTGTYPVSLRENLFIVLHDFQIGSGEVISDIVDTIPETPGANEDEELATVEAIRAFIVAYAENWGEDLYIPIITTPTAGNFPVMTADGELATSVYDHDTWITRVVGAIAGNIPLMQASGLLMSSAWEPADFVAVDGDVMTGDLTMNGAAKVVGTTILASTYHWFDRMGLNVTDDTGATRAAIHLGIDNADVGTPYFRSPAGNHYELYHEGNLKSKGYQSGAMKCTVTTPSAAGSVPVKQNLDVESWYQGDGNTLFNVTGGNVVVSEPGIYAVQCYVSTGGSLVIGVMVTDDTKSFFHKEPNVAGDLSSTANPVFIMDLADNAELTIKVFHPSGSVTPVAVYLIITKIGVTGAVS